MNITGIILAGGKSSRMGDDKCFVQLNNKPLIAYIIDTFLNSGINKIIINTNNPESFTSSPFTICQDEIKDKGPLGGIYTSLKKSKTENNIIIPCDSPFVSIELIQKLIENNVKSEISFPFYDKVFYPLISCCKKKSIYHIKSLINRRELKAAELINYYKTSILDLNKNPLKKGNAVDVLANINDRQNLKYYEEKMYS